MRSRTFTSPQAGACLLFILTGLLSSPAQADTASSYRSPAQWENWISGYEKQDAANPPPSGAIVCLGSSSMLGWHEMLRFDLEPLTVVPRAFGGSNTNDALSYADRIVLPYAPRAIVYYEGENDIAQGITPEQMAATFDQLVAKVHAAYPDCRFYVLSIKPSIERRSLWPRMQAGNALLKQRCEADERLTYVDVSAVFVKHDGADIDIGQRRHV